MSTWQLPSNDGRDVSSWIVRSVLVSKRRRYLNTEVVLTGRHLDRAKWTQGEYALAKEYSINLAQVLLSVTELKELARALDRWLRTPIRDLASTHLELSADLGGVDGQQFSLAFAPGYGDAATADHPMCHIAYRGASVAGECSYMVDQSCIRLFVDGMKEAVWSRGGV